MLNVMLFLVFGVNKNRSVNPVKPGKYIFLLELVHQRIVFFVSLVQLLPIEQIDLAFYQILRTISLKSKWLPESL